MQTHSRIQLYSGLSGLFVALLVWLSWQILSAQEESHIRRAGASIAHGAAALIRKDIQGRSLLLERLSSHRASSEGASKDDWNDVADRIYQAQLGYEVIARTDSSYYIRWLTPESGFTELLNKELSLDTPVFEGAEARRNTAHVVPPFELSSGEKALGIAASIPRGENNEFGGLIVGVLLFRQLFEDLIPVDMIAEHHVTIYANGELAYSNTSDGGPESQRWTEQGLSSFSGINWRIDVTPHYELVSLTYSRLQGLLLIAGLLLSLLAAATVHLLLATRERVRVSRATSSQLELLMENIPGMAYQAKSTDDWPMEFVSSGCELLTGHSKAEFENRESLFETLIHADDQVVVRESALSAIQEGRPFEFEYRIRTKNQEERWVWERGRASGLEQGGIQSIEGFIIDVTERKLVEISLAQNQAFSQTVLDTVEEVVVTFDGNGDIETVNSAVHKLFAYTPDELRGLNIDKLIPSVYLTENGLNPDNFKSKAASSRISFSRNFKAKHKDGSMFPIYFWLSEIAGHVPKKFVGLIRDRSFQVETKKENRRHTEQLAHIDRLNMLGEMAAGMAHEINQPLTAISLFAQAGKRLLDAHKYDQLPDVFDKLSGHALRAGDVIERMQSMAKPGEHPKQVIDCSDMIRETVKLAENETHLRDIEIEMIEGVDLPLVRIDRVQIQQVVLNLIRNAMQSISSQKSADSNAIKLRTQRNESGDLAVLIEDSGCGVTEDIVDVLFTPFSSSKKNGMGMGLSICQAIIIEHGGKLSFYNNESGGATFFFSLPPVVRSDHE